MTAVFASSDALDGLGARLSDPDMRRKAGAYGLAALVHGALVVLVLSLPPAVMPQIERAANAISVRLYTVAGGEQAETDAPLFEPPLAGGAADTAGEGSGAADQSGADVADLEPDIAESVTESAPVEDVEPAPEPDTQTEGEPAPEPDAVLLTAPSAQSGDAPASRTPAPSRSRPLPPPAPGATRDPGAPVATTQPSDLPEPGARRAGPPSFADILARAETRLDPEDFRLLANFGSGVRATVRESFCLSSVDANREAFDCPEGVNANSARLAEFGLMGLGEEAPEFLEDMDRLAFQLSTLGADDSAIQRILLSLRESRREVIEAGPLRRQMGRDSAPENGNDIPGAP